MPAPIPVNLHQHDPAWAEHAKGETARFSAVIGMAIMTVHHIGSTAVPGTRAKRTLDLMPVVSSHVELDQSRCVLEALGYTWWGEYGLSGRRYCTLDDASTGR